MEKAHIVGFRAHPDFTTLIQTVYECGHVYSQELQKFVIPANSEVRCTKCLTGVPADITGEEFATVCHQDLMEHPVIGRLAKALLVHLGMSEKRQYLDQGHGGGLDTAIEEARGLLEEMGLGFDPMGSAETQATFSAEQFEVEAPNGGQKPGYYYELPDLSII